MTCSGWRAAASLMLVPLVALVAGCAPVGEPSPARTPSAERGAWATLPASPLGPRNDAAGAWVHQRFVVVGGWANPP